MSWLRKPWKSKEIATAMHAKDLPAFNAAFSPFFQSKFPELLRWVLNQHRLNQAEAEDLVQDSMQTVWWSCWQGKVREIDQLDAFARSVVHRKVLKKFAPNRYLAELLPLGDLEVADTNEGETTDWMGESYHLLNQLGEKCKEILLMWAMKIPMKEIAEEMSYKSADVAKKTKERCMKTLVEIQRQATETNRP